MNETKKKGPAQRVVSTVITVLLLLSFAFFAYRNFLPTLFFNVQTPASGAGTGYYRHCYAELTEKEQKIYAVVLKNIYSCPKTIEIPSLDDCSLDAIFSALSYDNPDLFCLGLKSVVSSNGRKFSFEPEYSMSASKFSSELQAFRSKVKEVLAGAKGLSNDYDKELYFHDYIITHCVYQDSSSDSANTAYGCLVEGKASCEGYSRAFQYLLSEAGIDNRLVTGKALDKHTQKYVGHMWTYLMVDGQPYYTDLTWDDPTVQNGILIHTYFNITTAEILRQHKDIEQKIPECTATSANFYIREGQYVTSSGGSFSDIVRSAVAKAAKAKAPCAELKFANLDIQKAAMQELFGDGMVYDIYDNYSLLPKTGSKSVYYGDDETMNVLCLYV